MGRICYNLGMKLVCKRKIVSFHDKWRALDEQGNVLFRSKKRTILGPTKFKTIRNKDKQNIYFVKTKIVSGARHHVYILDQNKDAICALSLARISRLENMLRVDEGSDLISIKSLSRGVHEIYLKGELCGTFRQIMGFFHATYELDVAQGKYAGLVFTVAMAIDSLVDKATDRN